VEVKKLHSWQVNTVEALVMQRRLAGHVSRMGKVESPRFIGGLDISVNRILGKAVGAAVVLDYPSMNLVEVKTAEGELKYPYIPGLLSFREAPLMLAVCEQLTITPDVFIVDGQGIAHPRRLGLASHLGMFLDVPTIGCAKSRLCGKHEEPGLAVGSFAELTDDGEVIGQVLRTRRGIKPVYISIGNNIDLKSAVKMVLACCAGYRLPEPVRIAHSVAGENMKKVKA